MKQRPRFDNVDSDSNWFPELSFMRYWYSVVRHPVGHFVRIPRGAVQRRQPSVKRDLLYGRERCKSIDLYDDYNAIPCSVQYG